jgi:capsular polysaccharide biosynthesis protein
VNSRTSTKLVVPRKTFHRTLPVNLQEKDRLHFQVNLVYDCPDLFLYYFKRIHALAEGTLFRYFSPLLISFGYYKGRLKSQSVRSILSARVKWKNIMLGGKQMPYLVIHDQWTGNYYHWVTQALPRLLLAQKIQKDFVLLLPADHCSEFHLSSLAQLGVSSFETLAMNGHYYTINNLLFPSHDIQIGDYNDDLIRELAVKLRPVTHEGVSVNLFVRRKARDKRVILNEEEAVKVFLDCGFKVVELEDVSFEEQVALCAKATILAGVHGSGLANMIFMKEGSKVLELTGKLNGEQYYFYTLSNAMGHDYFYQLCEMENENESVQDSNIRIDVRELRKTLEFMLNPK